MTRFDWPPWHELGEEQEIARVGPFQLVFLAQQMELIEGLELESALERADSRFPIGT
jgi:hypothetical protein